MHTYSLPYRVDFGFVAEAMPDDVASASHP